MKDMQVIHIPSIKKRPLINEHGESCLFQIFWQDTESGKLFDAKKPHNMKSFENFARLTLNPGDTNRMHVHKDVEQVYLVVRGGGMVQVGEERKEVRAGDAIFLPANIPHGFFNIGEKTTILLLVGTKIK
jgi:mannose-6-phosphate isomerase-like protein (cupin superfamily)